MKKKWWEILSSIWWLVLTIGIVLLNQLSSMIIGLSVIGLGIVFGAISGFMHAKNKNQ